MIIQDYKIHCVVGAHPHERSIEQEIALDIEIEVDFTQSVLNDSIADTLNYEHIVSTCTDLARSRQYRLIETFTYEALHAILSAYPTIKWAKVRAKKKSALPLAQYAIIEFEKRQEDSP